MSFNDLSSPFIPIPPYSDENDSLGFWPRFQMGKDQPVFHPQFDNGPPSKRPKSSDDDSHLSVNRRMMPQSNPPINKQIGKIFFKTRLCTNFRLGQCTNGENCNFAHGEEDLRKPPPNWQELVGSGRQDDRGNGNWDDDDRINHKMKICKKFYNGEDCPYGERCNFLHRDPPVKFRDAAGRSKENVSRESFAIRVGTTTTAPPIVQGAGFDQYNGTRYWKTRLCTKWEITGQCPFGEKCHFAHGQTELQAHSNRAAEGELVNITPCAAKPLRASGNETAATKPEMGAVSNSKGQAQMCPLKWKVTKKINRIYADWIDDLPLNLPNEVEN
ncbi:hypothetical protein Nepgr_020791 [Nepenthes gracilis]|uniref:C3H1-type domain-containing protein n=1 Tax=Nepenthes gracilis TaxID=150966 RepID=A0AAD3SVX0_NEPGR|nr:hypothetical protein Nepgr_020791 [Nepenthes gracilis]